VAPKVKEALEFIREKLESKLGMVPDDEEMDFVDGAKYPFDRASYDIFKKNVDLADLKFDKTFERLIG